ncbi:hypothetical protein ES707_14144 [subsurface metagenome]
MITEMIATTPITRNIILIVLIVFLLIKKVIVCLHFVLSQTYQLTIVGFYYLCRVELCQ